MPQYNRLYHDLTWLWPTLSPVEDYEEEMGEVISLIEEYSTDKPKTLLDLGCGGGHNDYWLKRHFSITGVDLSEGMLALARQLNPEVRYLTGDMRSVRVGETVDETVNETVNESVDESVNKSFDVVFIADAIDYMLTEDDLRAAFETAYTHLKPGGLLLTYAEETKERFEQNKTIPVPRQNGDIELISVENYYDPDPDDTMYEMTFVYMIRQEGKLRIESDQHVMGVFPLATWIELLEEVGFAVEMVEYAWAGPVFVGKR